MARNKFVLNATSLTKSRSSWIQSKSHKTSIPFGKLVPLGAPIEILPGDTFKLDMGAIIRMLPIKAPIMDSISGDIYAYFVPNRLVFDKSKEFFGQNESQAWTLNLSYTIPAVKFYLSKSVYEANGSTGNYVYRNTSNSYNGAGGLMDHFELPFIYLNTAQYNSLPSSASKENLLINVLPFRGYQIIWNEDFRNPAVVDPVLTLNYDHSDYSLDSNAKLIAFDRLLPVMRYRDLFSSSLKAPQRGPSATIPLGTFAPLVTGTTYGLKNSTGSDSSLILMSQTGSSSPVTGNLQSNTSGYAVVDSDTVTSTDLVNKINLYADLSSASAATINTLRNSIALQHLYEMMTNAFRYQEYTQVFFGVRGSDATLQRPQQLGGIHFRMNVNQVLSTAETSTANIGQTGAFGIGEVKGHVYTNSFTEHGYIYLLIVMRKEHTYVQGLDKLWRKREFLDIFQPPLANIGNVDIKNSEVWFGFNSSSALDDAAFSYTEPYYEYRYQLSKACALMNPMAPGSLSYYSLTDVIASKPSLNSTFVSEDPNGLDNALFSSASVVDQFYGDFYFRYSCSRVMPLYSIPGLNRI